MLATDGARCGVPVDAKWFLTAGDGEGGADTEMTQAQTRDVGATSHGVIEGTHVALIGLGNIGGFAAGLLARLRGLARLTLIDRDVYDASNLTSQDIAAADVGAPKAVAQAERLRRITPSLVVAPVVDDVESVPLGLLHADVLVACLDSRRARQSVNQAAWRLGIPWIDAGVQADQSLARVNVYVPAADQPCLECAWDRRDYDLVEQVYPCGGAPAPATNAPASLGALAAALQVLECQKLLAGHTERAATGKQVLIDTASHRHLVTSFRRNPACRFDHISWHIEPLAQAPSALSVGAALALAADGCGTGEAVLGVEGQVFVAQLTCPGCGETRSLSWRLSGRLGLARQCQGCRQPMMATGFDTIEWLGASQLPAQALAQALVCPLADMGFQSGDVVTVRAGNSERHFELGPTPPEPGRVVFGSSLSGAC